MSEPKNRVPIPEATATEILFACDRTCCLCRTYGRRVQIHHIDDDPANNRIENLAVLCFECHDQTQTRGGFARRLSPDQVTRYRSDWIDRVAARRAEADRLAAQAMAPTLPSEPSGRDEEPAVSLPEDFRRLIWSLPELRRAAYAASQEGWGGGTLDMVDAYRRVTSALEAAWVELASQYPPGHFDGADPKDFLSEQLASRARWHYYCHSTGGIGRSGTIVQVSTASAVLGEVERMIEEAVLSLTAATLTGPDAEISRWLDAWRKELPR